MKIKNKLSTWTLLVKRNMVPLLVGLIAGGLLVGVPLLGSTGSQTKAPSANHQHEEGAAKVWTCSMHPQVKQPQSGSCPICGMDLIPVDSRADSDPFVELGPARVKLSPRAVKLAQLRTTLVKRRNEAGGVVRLLGRVEPNETTLKNVTSWIGGRIDRLIVKTTGERVHAGQKVATLYSPEVYAAHQDLIVAAKQQDRLQAGSKTARKASEAALSAARRRLALLGVPDDEVARMESQDQPTTAVSIRSPFGGTVMERFATEGSYVTTGARLYSVANLESLWIELDAYESDLPLLSVGQTVDIEVEAYAGEIFEGEITFIDPTLDQKLRTSKVRVKVDNQEGRLRPGMFAQALVSSETETTDAPLVIPASAPLFTGRRSVVYVEVPGENGLLYDARTVRLGPKMGELYPVVAGLSEGERVVSRGAFALDADLQIKGGHSMMMSPDDSEPGSWDDALHLSDADLRPLRDIMESYLAIQKALAQDDWATAKQIAATLRAALSEVRLEQSSEVKKAWAHVKGMFDGGAHHIAQSDSIEQARKGFEHLSGAVIMMLRFFGNPLDEPLSLAHCPMARGSEGANWIQQGPTIDNSYFGAEMRTCGDVQGRIEPGAHLAPRRAPASQSASMEGHEH